MQQEERRKPSLFLSPRKGIAWRLLTLIVLFSSAVTLFSTLIQLYLDYRHDVDVIESRLDEIERSYLASIGASLWDVDVQQLSLQLDGILRLPDMQAVEVLEDPDNVQDPLVVSAGKRGDGAVITREFMIRHQEREEPVRFIGTLYVEASLDGVYDRLLKKAAVILVTQGVKTFLVSMFILYIFYALVTRHLESIAKYAADLTLDRPPPPLALQRKNSSGKDELDSMVSTLNAMSDGLQKAYNDLIEVNVELEQDIVARRQAEQEIKRLNLDLERRVQQRTAELEAANKELASFSYSVSHDLRAPLRRIEGFGQILSDDYSEALGDKGQHYLDRIRVGATEMSNMVDSFLRLSRSSQGDLNIVPVNLSRMVEDIKAQLTDKEPERQVLFEIEPGLMEEGDQRLIKVMLLNLIENAWKYSRHAAKPKIEFGHKKENGRRIYYVRDNGAGFDMTFAERLFVPFSRLHRTEEFEGIGIGLATVHRVLARHGGRIWGEGAVGQGATFHFTLWEAKEAS